MAFQVVAICTMLVFYGCYFGKMINQKKKGIQIMSLFLCLVIFATGIPKSVFADEVQNKTFQIEQSVKVEDTSVNLKTIINYQIPSVETVSFSFTMGITPNFNNSEKVLWALTRLISSTTVPLVIRICPAT